MSFQLQETMLEVTKYDVHIFWLTLPGYNVTELPPVCAVL